MVIFKLHKLLYFLGGHMDETWFSKYFCKYINDDNPEYPFATYRNCGTEWSSHGDFSRWKYCKLAERDDD